MDEKSQIFRLRDSFKIFNEALLSFLQKLIEEDELSKTTIGSLSEALSIFVKISGVSSFKNSLKLRDIICAVEKILKDL